MNVVAKYTYKRPFNGSYAKNYIYISDSNEMFIETLIYSDKNELGNGEVLLRTFKHKQLIARSCMFSFSTAAVIGNIAMKHIEDNTIKGDFIVRNINNN